MFLIPMPSDFGVGDTRPVKINGQPAELHYRDKTTLVILPDDARKILEVVCGGEVNQFVCDDAPAPLGEAI
jgi:hypothetical protein